AALFLSGGPAGGKRAAEPEKYVPTPEELRESYQRAAQSGQPRGGVYKAQITPHWFAGNSRFWYRNDLAGGTREFILVDAEAGSRQSAFDHKRLAAALSKAAGKDYTAEKLPFDSIEFSDDGKAVRFRVGDTTWKCDLSSYECSRSDQNPMPAPADEPAARGDEETIARQESPWPDGLAPDGEQDQARQPQPPRPPERTERTPDG